jgi:hypothetical protein
MPTVISETYLRGIAKDLAHTITQPEFLDRMIALREAPADRKPEFREKVAVDHLRAQGLRIPDHLRVTTRTFERPEFAQLNGVQEMGKEPGADDDGPIQESYDTGTWGKEAAHLPMLMEDPEVVYETVMIGLDQVIEYVMSPNFQDVLADMLRCPESDRPEFVLTTFLDPAERARRGIEPPKGMRIQRSTFHDGRPTLFCVSILTPLAYPWRKLTVTFDNDIIEAARAHPEMLENAADA